MPARRVGGSADSAKAPEGVAAAPAQSGADAASKLNLATTAEIKTADLTVAAKDVNAAANSAIQIATTAGGGVSADVRTAPTPGDATSGSAQLTLKVLPDQLETTLSRLDGLGEERSRQSSSQDVTGQVADVTSRVASAQASIAQLQALFSKATAVGDIVSIEGQLSQREADLESLQAQQRALNAQTSFATVTLSLVALGAPVAVKHADRGGFVGGLADGWHAFTKALGWGLTGVGAVLPFAILLALIAWAAIVIRRRLGKLARRRRSARRRHRVAARITSPVIDTAHRPAFARDMRNNNAAAAGRYDRTLRVVMWLDALLSVELVVVATVVSPILAIVGATGSVRLALGLTALVWAVLLAAFGAITGIVLMLRMRAGLYYLPPGLNLRPLPSGMRPTISSASESHHDRR